MVALVFWIGLYPDAMLSFMHASVAHLLQQVHATAGAEQVKQVASIVLH
jgi:NADH-quinone oxidoreductase subunit M